MYPLVPLFDFYGVKGDCPIARISGIYSRRYLWLPILLWLSLDIMRLL
ncbi:hypothetical protein OUO_1401 [Helicobacter pylori R046Wa]|nr:hypothetical protein OUO_1401 [Helicobacter pylori R046Wa]